MEKILKNYIALIFILTPITWANSTEIEPINSLIKKNPDVILDNTQVEYFLTRCTSLYAAFEGKWRQELLQSSPNDKPRVQDLVERSRNLARFFYRNSIMASEASGNSLDFLEKRVSSLALVYSKKMSEGILYHNSILIYIKDDYTWCNELYNDTMRAKQ
jgi:hypothetical protein